MLARLEARRLLRAAGIEHKMVCTIHDSIVIDTPAKNLDIVAKILLQAVERNPNSASAIEENKNFIWSDITPQTRLLSKIHHQIKFDFPNLSAYIS